MTECGEVMTKEPFFCLPEDSAEKLAKLMGRRDIGPVLIFENKQTKKLAGIVTDRDLTLKVVAEGRDGKTTTANDVMTKKVVTVRVHDNVQKALDLMSNLQLRRIPVVDDNDEVVGILAQADVATRINRAQLTAEVVKGISQPAA